MLSMSRQDEVVDLPLAALELEMEMEVLSWSCVQLLLDMLQESNGLANSPL